MTQLTILPETKPPKHRNLSTADWHTIPEVETKPSHGGTSGNLMANAAIEQDHQEKMHLQSKDTNVAKEDAPDIKDKDIPCKKLERQALTDAYAVLMDDLNQMQNNRKLVIESALRDMSPEARKAWHDQVMEENRELMDRFKVLREKQDDVAEREAKERKKAAAMSSLKKIIAKDPFLNSPDEHESVDSVAGPECDADSTTSDSFCKVSSEMGSVHSGFEIMHFPHDDTEAKDDF